MSRRTSPIWGMPSDEFKKLIMASSTQKEVLDNFGMSNRGGNTRTLKRRMKEEGIDYSHFKMNYEAIASLNSKSKIPLEDCLVEDSTYGRSHLKKRLMKEGVLKNECSLCDQLPEWNGKPMVMVLDHINGVSNDHRLENLRMVCPNCNSQLPTHAGRNNKKPDRLCEKCSCSIWKGNKSGLCVPCLRERERKVTRPSIAVLSREVVETSYSAVGRKYGVSGNSIRKWMSG